MWLYYRFNLSHRDIEDLLAERGITVFRETIRLWCIKFGARERGMRRCKSMVQAQRFVTAHAAVQHVFYLGWHLFRAEHYRNLRVSVFGAWGRAVG